MGWCEPTGETGSTGATGPTGYSGRVELPRIAILNDTLNDTYYQTYGRLLFPWSILSIS